MITKPKGFAAGATTCGLKPSGAADLAVIASVHEGPCAAAGVFTKNRFPGAPVVVSRRHVRAGRARAIVCNSGISNVGTGEKGLLDAAGMCATVAEKLGGGATPRQVLPASTGIIGVPLPIDKIIAGIGEVVPRLARGDETDEAAARAILTTDTRSKAATHRVKLSTGTATLGAIAKGAGMIAPNMATMLAFVTTDAAIDARRLKPMLRAAAAATFNRISIDGDTSTSDMVLVLANGASGASVDAADDELAFAAALHDLCADLGEQLVRDGEGVTRLMRVTVTGAATERDADRVGRSVVDSPLVKCALHGGDANWGRLVMAVGKSGATLDPLRLSITVGGVVLLRDGEPVPRKAPEQRKLETAMQRDDVPYLIDLGQGEATATWIGCDLSREYVAINADYTT